jgi:hypothetical protein
MKENGWNGASPRNARGEEAKGHERRRSSGSERARFLEEESELRTKRISTLGKFAGLRARALSLFADAPRQDPFS